ncbi:MAG: glycosyltransferase family 39 protein [Fimbriimonadaceae bacterium]|nr:glycosyltransferase family 39 protein [Fimbriimonadaceae bacterium]
MRGGATFWLRGLAVGAGLAVAALAWQLRAGPLGWGAAMLAAALLGGAVLAGLEPPRAVARQMLGLLAAGGWTWLWHLNYAALLANPSFGGGLLAGLLLLTAASLRGAGGPWRGALLRRLRTPAGALTGGLWLLATARWFNGAEWRGQPADVVRGLQLLLTGPLAGLCLISAARSLPQAWLLAAEGWQHRLVARERTVVWALSLGTLAVVAHVCYRCVGPLPHVEDGIAYLYQAKTFLVHGFWQPAPAVPAAFDARFAWIFADDHGRSYGIFPPGWPLVLALGVALRLPWLVNPLLAALAVALAARLFRRVERPAVALGAGLLLATSPFFVLQGASFLAHTATLCWILLALLGAVGCLRGGGLGAAALVGLGVGCCAATRYMEGLLLGLACLGYLAWGTVQRRVGGRLWLVGLLALLPGLGLAVADNLSKTGSPLLTPVERWYTVEYGSPVNRPGFGPRVGLEWDHSLGPGHTLLEGLWNSNANAFELSRYGFGWACGSLLLALVFAVWGEKSDLDWLLLSYSLLLVGIYTAYWYHGIAFGPRFWHPLLLPLVLFTVKGGALVGQWIGPGGGRSVAATVALAMLTAWGAWLPLELQTTYHQNRGRDAGERRIVTLARAVAAGRPCLVIQKMHRAGGSVQPDYGIGFSLNPPGFRGDVLVARELDGAGRSQVAALRKAYPDRLLLVWYKDSGAARLVPLDDVDDLTEP